MEDLLKKLPDDLKQLIPEMQQLMTQGLENAPGYTEPGYKGYRYSLLFDSEATKWVYEEYEFEENTVILSSFPKTGKYRKHKYLGFSRYHICQCCPTDVP